MPPPSLPPHHLDIIGAENSDRVPVLCLHGLFAGGWVFDHLRPLIAERGYPAAALSFRGHPPNPPSRKMGGHSITDYCLDACEAARVLDRPIVIGHSLGGLVALMLVGRNLARAAILVSPAPPRGISVLSPGVLARMAMYLPALLLSRAFLPFASHLDALVLNRVPEADRAELRSRFVADSGKAARQAALGIFTVPPRAIRAPILVVGAEHDRFIPLTVARRVAQMYSAPLHVAQGHGHFLFAEPGWEREAKVMLDWIDDLPRVMRDASAEVGKRPLRTNSTVG